MPRSSFGGSQDLSSVFASFYAQYADRLESNTLQASRRAEEEQAATDNDTIDRWQQGEMTDEEFLAYVAERVAATAEDPTRNVYWKRVQRDTEKSILTEEVSDTAEDLVNQIEAGTKTWADLLAFYQNAQKSLRPSDPLYEDLQKQIEQVNDRIRDNQIAGEFERVQYQFEGNQISGKAAGAQLRSMAEQYRVNDPARYYQILQQALSLERYAGFYAGGSGSGRGSSAAPLNQLIDSLQGMEAQIGSLSEQYEDGVKVGAITVENADGTLSTEEVLLTNPDGTPSAGMRSLDSQMLETLGQLQQAYIEKGDRSAAGQVSNRLGDYITDHIQPRNTVGPSQQAAELLQTGLSLVDQAADSDDPVLAWNAVRAWASRVDSWSSRLNKTITLSDTGRYAGKKIPDKGEATTTVAENPLENRTTGDFADLQVASLRDFAIAVANGDSAAAAAAYEGLAPPKSVTSPVDLRPEAVGSSDAMKLVASVIDLVVGIPQGKYARAYVPGEGLVYAPMAPSYAQEIGPNGLPQTIPVPVPVFANGDPIFNESVGEQLVDVMVQIGGRAQSVFGVVAPAYVVDGRFVSSSAYIAVFQHSQPDPRTNRLSTSDAAWLATNGYASTPVLQQYGRMLIPGRNGQADQTWFFDTARDLWFKNKVTKYGGVPRPFIGTDSRLAQREADRLGIDPKGTSYFKPTIDPTLRGLRGRATSESDWYTQAKTLEQRQAKDQAAEGFKQSRGALGQLGNAPFISQALKAFGAQLGVRSFDAPSTTPKPFVVPHQVPLESPKITLPKITLPTPAAISQPKLVAPTTTKLTSSQYAGKIVPL